MPEFQHLRILVVDDNEHMRTLLRRLLSSIGINHVLEAADGQAGIGTLCQNECDVVLSDLDMRPMNGIDFAREVRTSRHSSNCLVPIIMITGHTEMAQVERARDAGITEFIVKPVSAKALIGRLTEIVERPRPFIRSIAYVGPDRRRKRGDGTLSRRQEDKR